MPKKQPPVRREPGVGVSLPELAIVKNLLNNSMLAHLEQQLELEGLSIVEAAGTRDYQEGLAAFLGKRAPVFKG